MLVYRYMAGTNLSLGIIKIENGIITCVPNCPGNRDWDTFTAWLRIAGNIPKEAW